MEKHFVVHKYLEFSNENVLGFATKNFVGVEKVWGFIMQTFCIKCWGAF